MTTLDLRKALRHFAKWIEEPFKFVAIKSHLEPGAMVLDAGCGNHSPSLTKRLHPGVVYHGIDNSEWNRDAADDAAMDVFYDISLDDEGSLRRIPDGTYDAVICSHVLEHLQNPMRVALELADKIAPDGVAYFECPVPESVNWPSAKDGFLGVRGVLNFYDDPTHTKPVDLAEVARVLRLHDFDVRGPIPRRLWRRVVLFPAYVVAGLLTRGYVPSSVVWDVVGFAEAIVVTRRYGQVSRVQSAAGAANEQLAG